MLNRIVVLRLRAVPAIVELAVESWMDDRYMVSFEIVINVDFPITINIPVFTRCKAHIGVITPPDTRREVPQIIFKRSAIGIEINKNKSSPDCDFELRK